MGKDREKRKRRKRKIKEKGRSPEAAPPSFPRRWAPAAL
jgi:hypothetical protein